jgi:hypothetical protein
VKGHNTRFAKTMGLEKMTGTFLMHTVKFDPIIEKVFGFFKWEYVRHNMKRGHGIQVAHIGYFQ